MISNINFENAEVTILKVIPPIDRCMEQINQRGRSFEVGSLSIDYGEFTKIKYIPGCLHSFCTTSLVSSKYLVQTHG